MPKGILKCQHLVVLHLLCSLTIMLSSALCSDIGYLTFFEDSGVNMSSRVRNVNLIAFYLRLFGSAVRYSE